MADQYHNWGRNPTQDFLMGLLQQGAYGNQGYFTRRDRAAAEDLRQKERDAEFYDWQRRLDDPYFKGYAELPSETRELDLARDKNLYSFQTDELTDALAQRSLTESELQFSLIPKFGAANRAEALLDIKSGLAEKPEDTRRLNTESALTLQRDPYTQGHLMPQKEFEQFRHNLGMEKTSHEFKLRDALGESDFERRYRKMPDLSATKQLPTEGIDYSTAPFMSKLSKTNRNNLNEYMPIIRDAAKKYGVPVEMVIAVMHRESRFNPNARGAAGEIGLMQLMPGTARELGVSDPTNPLQNIHGGVRYLREKLDDNGGDEALAMAAYNAGQGNVNKYGGIPFKTTREYVRTNLANMEELRGMSQEPAYTATNIQVGSSGWQADYVETGQADAGGGFDPSSIDGLVVSSAKLGDDGKWSFTFKPPEDVTPGDVLNDVSKYRQGLMDYAQKRFVVSDGAKPNPKMVYDAEKGNAWVTERMNEYMAAMPPHLRGMLTPQGSVQSATPSGQAGSGVGALLETVVPQMQNAQIPAEDADIGEYIIPNDPNNP